MPRRPAWINRLNEIKALAEASSAFAFDRAALAELFNVSQRQARNLLDEMGAERIGGAYIVSRSILNAYLEGRAVENPGIRELERRESVAQKLIKIREKGPQARAVRAVVPHDSSLPKGVMVTGPGELKINFDSRDPVSSILGIMVAIGEQTELNSVAFADSLKYQPPGEEEDE